MHKNERNNHLEKKCCPKFPVKLPHTKYRENKKYACFCTKLFDFMNTEGDTITSNKFISTGSCTSTAHVQCSAHRLGCLESVEKATQKEMEMKNVCDAYILEGLLNTSSDIDKTYVKVNTSDSVICENKSLSDIKQLLLTTNDKLDVILKKLMEKGKPKKLKPTKRKQNTISELTLGPKQNGLLDLPNLMNIPTNYANTNFARSKIKEYAGSNCSIYPYNTAYYMYGTNTNYLKALGSKYSEEEIANGLWNPFLFMASNIHASKFVNSNHHRINNPGITYQGTLDFRDMEQSSCDQD